MPGPFLNQKKLKDFHDSRWLKPPEPSSPNRNYPPETAISRIRPLIPDLELSSLMLGLVPRLAPFFSGSLLRQLEGLRSVF